MSKITWSNKTRTSIGHFVNSMKKNIVANNKMNFYSLLTYVLKFYSLGLKVI